MVNETPLLKPIIPKHKHKVLSEQQLEEIQAATIEILSEVGFYCPSEKALAIYAEHGGQVDFDEQLVKLPGSLVMEAMAHAPRYYTLGSRSPDHDLVLNGTATYVATDGIANSASATVSINVVPVPNIPPVANDDETVLPVGNNNSITINVVTNDTDADGTIDPNTVSIIDEPAGNIDVVNNGDGTVELTRGNNSRNQATRTFTYTVNDNDGDVSNIATVTITVPPPAP